MCCEVRDVSMVWSYISQPPGQDSTAKGESLLGGVMFPPVWGDPPTSYSTLRLVCCPSCLSLLQNEPLCKHGFALDGGRENPGLGKTESKVIPDEWVESCLRT